MEIWRICHDIKTRPNQKCSDIPQVESLTKCYVTYRENFRLDESRKWRETIGLFFEDVPLRSYMYWTLVTKKILLTLLFMDRRPKVTIFISLYVVTNLREKAHTVYRVSG